MLLWAFQTKVWTYFRGGVGSEIWVGQVGIRAKVTWQNMSASCKGDGGRGNDNEMNFLHPW